MPVLAKIPTKTLTLSEIKLSNGVRFSIVHNLPKMRGMNVYDAMVNWLARTKKYTAQSFCEYILSKDPINFIAMPYDEFLKIQ